MQFDRFPDAEAKEVLARAGVKLLGYLPDNAGFASLANDLSPEERQALSITAIETILTADKLADRLRLGSPPASSNPDGTIELMVRHFADVTPETAIATLQRSGAIIESTIPSMNMFIVKLDAKALPQLAAEDCIRWIEVAPGQAKGESNRARAHVQADLAQGLGLNGFGVIVGVFDGGHVATDHGDLPRVTQMDSNAFDPQTHPTLTAGFIGGNGSGSANRVFRGMAPACTIFTYKFDNSVPGDFVFDLLKAVIDDKVSVANNSWGVEGCATPYGTYDSMCGFLDAVAINVFTNQPTVVFSAGNERNGIGGGRDLSCLTNTSLPFENYATLNQPKSAKNIIVVGAVDSFPSLDQINNLMTDYSSWGPTADGRIKPDLVGSGHHHGTRMGSISVLDNPFGSNPNGSFLGSPDQQGYRTPIFPEHDFVYGWFTETSAAAAEASGCIALLIQDFRANFGGIDPRPATVKALLIHTALDLQSPGAWYAVGPDYASGYGLLQISNAVQTMRSGKFIEEPIGVNTAEEKNYRFNVPVAGLVNITLAWDDSPGNENAAIALVNDLDLIVTDPSGTRRYPWTLDPANPSLAAVQTQEDHLNNVEKVTVSNGQAGTWCVAVRGASVPIGPQRFSLVADFGLTRIPGVIVNTNNVLVSEGGQGTFRVKLASPPSTPAETVRITRFSGDTDISVLTTGLTFTPANWNVFQTVTLAGREDGDILNGVATIRCGIGCRSPVEVTATEIDTGVHFPTLSINNVAAGEPFIGTRDVLFTASLSRASSDSVKFSFATVDGSAIAGADYVATGGTAKIPAESLSVTIPVTIKADQVLGEPDETFGVRLSNPANATLSDAFGVGVIRDTFLFSGAFDLSPGKARAHVGEPVYYSLTWTVPEGEVWRNLKTLDLRFREGNRIPLWVHWDESANTFSVCDKSGKKDSDVQCTAAELPGSAVMLQADSAQLDLAHTTVVGSGPTGRSVTLNLAIIFGKKSPGHYQIELSASDDLGHNDDFVPASEAQVDDASQ